MEAEDTVESFVKARKCGQLNAAFVAGAAAMRGSAGGGGGGGDDDVAKVAAAVDAATGAGGGGGYDSEDEQPPGEATRLAVLCQLGCAGPRAGRHARAGSSV